jgi:glycerophosphoryl diester phosphodiesterase
MTLTRRSALATAAALAAGPTLAQPAQAKPLIIGHRGASGERPEHTLMGYRLAIAEGADFIEPDCVLTKDGHLVVRHENEIGGTTDVARRPEFAGRRTSKVIDGQKVAGWFTEDFTLAELKTLRARERLPQLRPGSAKFDGHEPIPTYQEVVDLAKAESRRVGRTIGTYPEMKHPTYFASAGLPMEARLAEMLKKNGLDSRTAPVFVQCFEPGPLKTFKTLSKARRVMLVSQGASPVDYKSETGLKAIAAFADGLGPEWPLTLKIEGSAEGIRIEDTGLVKAAHAAGLVIHPWTIRAENAFLPPALRVGTDPRAHGSVLMLLRLVFRLGVDGLFSDFPGLAAEARA